MDITVLMSIAFGLVAISLTMVLVKVFKDRKSKGELTNEQKQVLQDIIIETFNETIEISTLKTEQELKDYCVLLVMNKLKENNIQGINEKTVRNSIELLLKINKKLNEALEKKINK